MRILRKNVSCAVFVLVMMSFFWLKGGIAAPSTEEIVKTWKARQGQFKTVRFRISGNMFLSAGYLQLPEGDIYADGPLVPVPAADYLMPIRSELLLNFKDRKLWRRQVNETLMWDPKASRWVYFPRDEVVVYNGELYKSYRPHELNLAKSPKPHSFANELGVNDTPTGLVFSVEHKPLLYACGIIPTQAAYDPINLRPEIDPSRLRMGGEVQLDGANCVLLRTVPDAIRYYYEFLVDADDPRIIRQVDRFNSDNKIWFTTKITYQNTEYGPIPDIWTIDFYSFETEGKVKTKSMKLDEFEANPKVTDADFDVEPPPGTRVYDARRPKDSREYVIAGPGKPDLPLGEHLLQEEQKRSRRWLFAGIVGVMILLLGAGFFVYRRRRA